MKRTLLVVGEGVTLAHFARPWSLVRRLADLPEAAARFELHFACDRRYRTLVDRDDIAWHELSCLPPAEFLRRLEVGAPVMDEATLTAQVQADLHLLNRLRPAAVIGDMRLSLAISCRLTGIPYLSLASAQWSPFSRHKWPAPAHPLVGRLGLRCYKLVFNTIRPAVFAQHAKPYAAVSRRYGLAAPGGLCEIYTEGDEVLYPDVASLFPLTGAPANHRFVGPLLWEPSADLPAWWARVADSPRRKIYISLGSSGPVHLLDEMIAALADMPVDVMVATAGRARPTAAAGNVWVADVLPGGQAARLASVVVTNGGSAGVYQALAAGRPVIGLAQNLDQHLTMQAVTARGAGVVMRSDRFNAHELRDVVAAQLAGQGVPAARALAGEIAATDPADAVWRLLLQRLMGGQMAEPASLPAGTAGQPASLDL